MTDQKTSNESPREFWITYHRSEYGHEEAWVHDSLAKAAEYTKCVGFLSGPIRVSEVRPGETDLLAEAKRLIEEAEDSIATYSSGDDPYMAKARAFLAKIEGRG